jgi:beta-lactamase class A
MQIRRLAIIGTITLLLCITSFALGRNTAPKTAVAYQEAAQYPLLAQRIFTDDQSDNIVNFAPLRKSLRAYYDDNQLEGGIYFEYLPTGTSIRVDGDEEEVAASLFKLPAAMDLYRAAEMGTVDLDKKIALQPEWLDKDYGTLHQKGAGYRLSLRDAAKIMLTESDNTALKAVSSSIAGKLKSDEYAFNSLDVDITQNADFTVSVGPRGYSSFLKCLYFSCYLTHHNSDEILRYLSESKFNGRLVAGIADKSIKVAHKIGVASTTTQSDCGIVYLPRRHYVACIMIRGAERPNTDKHIAELSKRMYEYLQNK